MVPISRAHGSLGELSVVSLSEEKKHEKSSKNRGPQENSEQNPGRKFTKELGVTFLTQIYKSLKSSTE